MAFARLVVIAGPDLGREYDVPMRGGSIGRDGAGLVVLSDPAVSRLHCHLELREEAMWLVDDSGKGRTLVNGAPITIHRLQAGDELVLGTTRLSFLGGDGDGDGARASRPGAGKVTMEVSSRQLMALVHGRGDDRAQRTLAAIAEFGDRLRADSTAGPAVVARAACELALTALGAQRAFVLVGASGRLGPLAERWPPASRPGRRSRRPGTWSTRWCATARRSRWRWVAAPPSWSRCLAPATSPACSTSIAPARAATGTTSTP